MWARPSTVSTEHIKKLIPVSQAWAPSRHHSEVSWTMKVGLLSPWQAAAASGTTMASLSLLPPSIPFLIFSGNVVVSTDSSWL